MNPFLQFGEFVWQRYRPEYINEAIKVLIKKSQENLDKIIALETVSFESVILGIERATMRLDRAWGIVCHLDGVCNSDELRKAKNEVLPLVTEFYASIRINEGLWRYIVKLQASEEAKSLEPLEARMLKQYVESFYDNGAQLSPEGKETYKKYTNELSKLSQKYSENVLDSENAFELYIYDSAALRGVPETILNAMRADAAEKGHTGEYRLSLTYSIYGPLMKYLDDAELRERLYRAHEAVARDDEHDNSPLISHILQLRNDKARLLGFANFADFALKYRMAKNGVTALNFVDDLFAKTAPYFENEQQMLESYCERFLGHERFNPWDVSYLMEKIRRERFDFDQDALRRFFKVDNVIDGLFSLAQELYGVRFESMKTFYSEDENAVVPEGQYSVWHPDVRYYRMIDEDGQLVGHFYTDWHPRASKHSGAWQNTLQEGGMDAKGVMQHPIALVVGSLTASTPQSPSLLTHDEVETIFHEFGHLLHAMFGKVKYYSMNGCNVAWDFVELPSQLNENFIWNKMSLVRFAKDYYTGEPIDDKTIDYLLASRTFMAAWMQVRYLSFAKLDLDLHINYAAKYRDCTNTEEALYQTLKAYNPRYLVQPHLIINAFSHIFSGGYAASYYSYKWAEVLEADIFNRFLDAGVVSAAVGRNFKHSILEKGDSKDAAELFRDFMGRDPDSTALYRRNGFLVD